MNAKGNAGEGCGLSAPPDSPGPNSAAAILDAFLASLAGLLIRRASPEEIAALVLETAKRLTVSPHGYVGFVDPDSGRLVCPTLTTEVWERCRVAGRQLNLRDFRGLLGWVREHRQPLISNHPAEDPRAVGVPPGHLAIARLLSVPVVKGDNLLGQISVANAPRDYSQDDAASLARLAELFALALRHALDERELERSCRELDERVLERTGHLRETAQRLQQEMSERRQIEQEMDLLFRVSPDLICVADRSGYFTRVNPAFQKILGYTAQEALSRPLLDFVHPDDRQKTLEEMANSFGPQGSSGFENRYLAKDGGVVWLSWSAMPDPGTGCTYAVARDISRSKANESALRESNERFRMIFEQSPVGAALFSPEHRFERVNQEYCRFLGRRAEELVGLSFADVTHPEELALDMECVQALQSGAADSCTREKRYLRGDGQIVWGRARVSVLRDAQGQPRHALSLIEDITEQHQADQERLLAEQRQAALLALHRMADRTPQEVCDFALEEGTRLTGSELGYIYFLNAEETTLSVHSWSRRAYEVCLVPGQPSAYKVADTGLWGEAVRQRRPIITNDYAAPNRFKKGLPAGHPPLTRHMNVPIFDGRRIVAVAGVANKPDGYDEGDVAMLQLLMEGMWSVIERQRGQEVLRQSETLFRQMFETNRSVKLLIDPADGSIVRANQAARAFYGYGPEEFAALKITDINLLSAEEVRQEMERAAREERLYFEFPHRLASGEVRQVEVYSGPVTLQGRPLLHSIIHDVTARKQTEQALRHSEERFRLAFKSSPMGVALIDRDGRFLEVNASLCAMLGYTSAEMLGLTFAQVTHPDDQAACLEGFRRVLAGASDRLGFEKRYVRKDGAVIWGLLTSAPVNNEQGEMIYLISQVIDVTAHKQAEQALKESEEKFAKAFQAGPVYMIISDLGDGRILEVNEAFARALGYTRAEMIGATALELNIWCDPGQRKALIEAVLRGGGVRDMEAEARTRDGRTFTSLVSAERIQVGGRDCLLGVALDISERRALEEQARLAQKRESLAIMAGGVAHDFNNLLQTILGNADLALLDVAPSSAVAESLHEVQEAAQRAAELAHKMLAYSGHTPFIPRPLGLSELARQALPQLRQGLPAWISLEQDLTPGLPGLEGDQSLLRQALQNLVTNAAEALDTQPGVIIISTGRQACDRAFLDSTYLGQGLAQGEYVFLRVEDSGPGMDRETASKAFDPFFTTKFPGRGLGLAVVLGVVRAHQGAVRIEPRPGGGNRVSLFLPVAPQPAPAPKAARSGPQPASPLVLLVDDEEAVRLVAQRMLEKHGFAVLTASDGRQALEALRQAGGDIGVILADLNMPGMSGENLVQRMLALAPTARIVVSSSLEQNEIEASLASCPIAGFIQKPYRMATLIELLRQSLEAPATGA